MMQASSPTTDISSTSDVPPVAPCTQEYQAAATSTSMSAVDSLPPNCTSEQAASADPASGLNPEDESEVCGSSEQMGLSKNLENENDNCSVDPDDGDNASEISDFSNFSQESWQPVQGPIAWVQEQMRQGQSPRKILGDLVPSGTVIPEGLDPIMLWKIIINIVSEPPKRKKLPDINTLEDVLHLLKSCKKIVVLTGAGVSVSCGIPDFRSRDGVYARLAKDFPNLPDPQAMFDIHFFRNDPRPFFKFAREIYPGQFQPSLCHKFIRLLEEKEQLLRNYTQNIDTLEQVAGIQRVVQCHGSFATATCAVCGHKVGSEVIKEDIFNQVIPHCPICPPTNHNAVMKPDIVFFGESLPEHFHNQMAADKDECDLLIVIGSSLKVRPVALIPNSLPANVPQILINRERLRYLNFDVELLGNCDDIVGELCRRLGPGWEQLAAPGPPLDEIAMSSLPTPPISPQCGESADKWDESSNAAVSSSEVSAAKVAHFSAFGSSEKPPGEEVTHSGDAHDKLVPPDVPIDDQDGDGGVPEVSTSQSESALTKMHKPHHHRHSLKRPFSSLGTPSSLQIPSDQLSSDLSQPDETVYNSCSSTEVETLVNACHKRDVMYIPNEKTSNCHHGPHHSHDTTKSHSHHHERSKPSVSNLHSQPSTSEHSISHHNDNITASGQPHLTCMTASEPAQPSDTLQASSSMSVESTASQHDSGPAEADSQDLIEGGDDSSPSSKRPRLSSGNEENTDKDRKDPNDSLSFEESLDDIRKMWRSKRRVSLAQRLTENQVLFLPPSRYVFKGAEVFSESESEDSDDADDDDDDSGSSIDSDVEADPLSAQESIKEPNTVDDAADSTCVASCLPDPVGNLPQQKPSLSVVAVTNQSKDISTVDSASNLPDDNVVVDSAVHELSETRQLGEGVNVLHIPLTQTVDTGVACPVTSTEDFHQELTAQNDNGCQSLQGQSTL